MENKTPYFPEIFMENKSGNLMLKTVLRKFKDDTWYNWNFIIETPVKSHQEEINAIVRFMQRAYLSFYLTNPDESVYGISGEQLFKKDKNQESETIRLEKLLMKI